MTGDRRTPMVPMHCRIRPDQAERIARLTSATGTERCDVIRRVIDAGCSAVERELSNGENGGQS